MEWEGNVDLRGSVSVWTRFGWVINGDIKGNEPSSITTGDDPSII